MSREPPKLERGVEVRPALRRAVITFRLSPLEKADIERTAKKRGFTTVSDYLRFAHSLARDAK